MDISRSTMKKLMGLIAFAAACFALCQRLEAVGTALTFIISMLAPFLIGSALAFILNVPMRFIENKLFSSQKVQKKLSPALRRVTSLLLTFAFVILLIAVLVLVIAPQLATTVAGLGVTIQAFIGRVIALAETQFANNPELMERLNSLTIDWRSIDWEGLLTRIMNFLKNGAGDVLSSTISAAKGFVSGIATTFVAFVFSCYLLLQKEKLGLQFRKAFYALLPKGTAKRFIEICTLSHRVFASFITGQCLEAIILGGMFFVTMTILRMPYALLVGCLIAVTALIPIVGAFIGCGVGAFLILMVSPTKALIFVVMFLVLQQIEGNLIYPHVVGSSVGLPSIWVLAAVSVGGSLMGVVGMLIFIPLVSVVYTLFREFVHKRLKEKGIKMKEIA